MRGKELGDKLLELYYVYENYCITQKQSMSINIDSSNIEFKLFKGDSCIDQIIIKFESNKREKKLHDYLTLFLTAKIFGCVEMHFSDNEIYNNRHRSYLKYTINDENTIICQTNFLDFAREHSSELRDILSFSYDDVKKTKIINTEKKLSKRIDISKDIIRKSRYDKESRK